MDLKHCSTETVFYHSSVMINIWKMNFYTFEILLDYGITKTIKTLKEYNETRDIKYTVLGIQ